MPSVEVVFVDRTIGPLGRLGWRRLHGPPKIANEPIEIIYSFDTGDIRTPQQHRARPEERLDKILDIPKPRPHLFRDLPFAAEPQPTTGTEL